MSESRSIAEEKVDAGRASEAPVFSRSCSLLETGDIKGIGQEKLGVVEKSSEAHVAGELVCPVPNRATRNASWSWASLVPGSGGENADLVILRAHIQVLQAQNEDLLARRAGK